VDGFALCQAIREHDRGMDVPIIVMSAIWKQPALLDKLRDTYGVSFLEKPFKVDDLVRLVKSLLPPGP
jgi:DNA-binding response OmpR family regulator